MEQIVRLENKYLVDEGTARAIAAHIAGWCEPDRFGGDDGYPIHSLYFDSDRLDLYQANQLKQLVRWKARVRSYGPGSQHVYLELKRKTGDLVRKSRVKLPLLRWPHVLDAPRSGLEPELTTAGGFLSQVDRIGLVPQCHILYQRQAFTSLLDDYLRITFDRELAAIPAHGDPRLILDPDRLRSERQRLDDPWTMNSPCGGSAVILEIKCVRHAPRHLLHLVERFALVQQGISKYVLGIEATRHIPDRRRSIAEPRERERIPFTNRPREPDADAVADFAG